MLCSPFGVVFYFTFLISLLPSPASEIQMGKKKHVFISNINRVEVQYTYMNEVAMNTNDMQLREYRSWKSGLHSVAPGERKRREGHRPRLVGHFQMIPSQVTCAKASHLSDINTYNYQNAFPILNVFSF